MDSTLYFSGHAENTKAAGLFLDIVHETAERQKLVAARTENSVVIDLEALDTPVAIQFNDQDLFEGSITAADGTHLQKVASLFVGAYQHLAAFLLVTGESTVLFEHGDVEAMEALLDEELKEVVAADMDLDTEAMGPNDTKWFNNCRFVEKDGRALLQISVDAKSRMNDGEWKKLEAGVNKLRGVNRVTPTIDTLGFELGLDIALNADESRRLAIATSFMVDDAIVATREADGARK